MTDKTYEHGLEDAATLLLMTAEDFEQINRQLAFRRNQTAVDQETMRMNAARIALLKGQAQRIRQLGNEQSSDFAAFNTLG